MGIDLCRAAQSGLLIALFALVPGAADGQPKPQLVDMVVAEIDLRIVTYSELVAEARLAVLDQRGPAFAKRAVLNLDLLRAVLRNILARELLLAESRRLQLREVTASEIDNELSKMRQRFAHHADYIQFLEQLGFEVLDDIRQDESRSPADLVSIVRANLQVAKFVELRIRPNLILRDADVKQCYQRNQAHFSGRSLAESRAVVERALRDELQGTALRELLAQLEAQVSLRFAPDFRLRIAEEPRDAARDPATLRCTKG